MLNRQIRRLLQIFAALPPRVRVALCLATLGILIAADLSTDSALVLTMLYLAPIALATWYIGAPFARALTAASACAWLADELLVDSRLPIILWNTGVRFGFFLIFIGLMISLRESYHREHAMARRDPLTGALNRRAFHDLLEDELARMRRIGMPMTLAYLDLDNFKAINDLLGHSVGDELLIQVATLAHNNLRTIDRVARLGGDEFVIILPATDVSAAQIALERLKHTLQEAMRERHWPVTLSVGAVAFYTAPVSLDQAISLADHTMYAVKRAGKDQVQVIGWGQGQGHEQPSDIFDQRTGR